jgi:hypothetical protein
MDTQLTHAARIELARSLRRRYQAASSRAKKQILHEFIAVMDDFPHWPQAISWFRTHLA